MKSNRESLFRLSHPDIVGNFISRLKKMSRAVAEPGDVSLWPLEAPKEPQITQTSYPGQREDQKKTPEKRFLMKMES
jgi:hypothetical protein